MQDSQIITPLRAPDSARRPTQTKAHVKTMQNASFDCVWHLVSGSQVPAMHDALARAIGQQGFSHCVEVVDLAANTENDELVLAFEYNSKDTFTNQREVEWKTLQ